MGTPSKKPLAASEHAWNLLEDRLPRSFVLSFHSYLRDQEDSAGFRFDIGRRHAAFRCFSRFYPEVRSVYAKVYGHTSLLDVSMPTDTDQVSL